MGERRAARVLALQCLHAWEAHGPDSGRRAADEVMERLTREPMVRDYCRRLLAAYWDHATEIDERLAACAENWSLDRMAVVDRNVLRLAAAELLHLPETPPKAAIDEAIEIVKRFSTEKSGAFVNGILDRVLSEREEPHGAG